MTGSIQSTTTSGLPAASGTALATEVPTLRGTRVHLQRARVVTLGSLDAHYYAMLLQARLDALAAVNMLTELQATATGAQLTRIKTALHDAKSAVHQIGQAYMALIAGQRAGKPLSAYEPNIRRLLTNAGAQLDAARKNAV